MSKIKTYYHEEISENLAKTITLEDILKTHKVKFTKPQQVIVDKLMAGYKLAKVNSHRMSSTYQWLKPGYEGKSKEERLNYGLEYAGRVYKAFWNIGYAVKKQIGIALIMGQYVVTVS